jgi:fibronectin type 3 domain-containing protein
MPDEMLAGPSATSPSHFFGFYQGGTHMHVKALPVAIATMLLTVFAFTALPVQAVQVQLSWDAPTTNADGTPLTDLAGYIIYYGQSSGQYGASIDAGLSTAVAVSGLEVGQTYYFAATAYDTSSNESDFSNELTYTPSAQADIVRINFQPSGAPVPASYQQDTGARYNAARGYGWNKDLNWNTRDRNVNADQRLDTFVFVDAGTAATWRYTLPNGHYLISLASGDASFSQGPHRVLIEGIVVIKNVPTNANQYVTRTDVPITVSDGELTVRVVGTSGNSMLNYLIIKQ